VSSWEPFRCVKNAVMRDPQSKWTAPERLVALAVADCMDAEGSAHPSVALIASRTRLGRRTVQRALAGLSGPNGIFAEQTGGSSAEGGRTSSVYRLLTRAMVAPVPAPQGRRSDPRHSGTGATDDSDPRHSGAVRTQEGPIDHDVKRRVAARIVRKTPRRGTEGPWVKLACEDWNARFGSGSAQPGRIAGGLAPVVNANGFDVIRPAWQRYLRGTGHPAPSAQDFAAHWSDWRLEAPREMAPEPTSPEFYGPRRLS